MSTSSNYSAQRGCPSMHSLCPRGHDSTATGGSLVHPPFANPFQLSKTLQSQFVQWTGIVLACWSSSPFFLDWWKFRISLCKTKKVSLDNQIRNRRLIELTQNWNPILRGSTHNTTDWKAPSPRYSAALPWSAQRDQHSRGIMKRFLSKSPPTRPEQRMSG